MKLAARARDLALVSFVSLSVGFAAGWWLARQEPGTMEGTASTGAPHAVGAAEHMQLGEMSLEAGDFSAAEAYFREALELEPGSAQARAELGAALLLQGRYDEARDELETARETNPENPEAWFFSGLLWRDGYGDRDQAREAWERFLTLMPPESEPATTVRGWLAELDTAPVAP
jgi:tetratricopeptide (TPR) repeat protein